MDDSTRLQELVGPIEKPIAWHGKRARALHPFAEPDRPLLEAIGRGEFLINGLRNKDLVWLLHHTAARSDQERRRRSCAISRKLRLLRAHHLIRKVPHTHRYHLTAEAAQLVAALIAAANAPVNLLIPKAA